MDTFAQVFRLPVTAAGAVLAGVGGADRGDPTTGPFCLVRHRRDELPPRCIMDRLGEAVVVHHPVNRQVLHADDAIGVHELAGALVREVGTLMRDALVYVADRFLGFVPCRRLPLALPRFGVLRQAALHFGQGAFAAPRCWRCLP